jgi:hypothetical protein
MYTTLYVFPRATSSPRRAYDVHTVFPLHLRPSCALPPRKHPCAPSPTNAWRAASVTRVRPPATAEATGRTASFRRSRAGRRWRAGRRAARARGQRSSMGVPRRRERRQVATRTRAETTRRTTGRRGRRLGREPQLAAACSRINFTTLLHADLRALDHIRRQLIGHRGGYSASNV